MSLVVSPSRLWRLKAFILSFLRHAITAWAVSCIRNNISMWKTNTLIAAHVLVTIHLNLLVKSASLHQPWSVEDASILILANLVVSMVHIPVPQWLLLGASPVWHVYPGIFEFQPVRHSRAMFLVQTHTVRYCYCYLLYDSLNNACSQHWLTIPSTNTPLPLSSRLLESRRTDPRLTESSVRPVNRQTQVIYTFN